VTPEALRDLVVDALEDRKGRDIVAMDVARATNITDFMVLASGTSNRHVKALVDQVIEAASARGNPPLGVEGRETFEWVLIDLGDVIVHVMQAQTREFYDLERLWSDLPADSEQGV
jgi:ribosome-associated protein